MKRNSGHINFYIGPSILFSLWSLWSRRCGFGRGFLAFALFHRFARNEFLFGLGEFKCFALAVLYCAARGGELFAGRLAVPAGHDRQLLADRPFAEDFHRELIV